jgi:hypothetical protein
MTFSRNIIADKNRHICSYVLYMSDKMRHISKFGEMPSAFPRTEQWPAASGVASGTSPNNG